MNILNTLAQSSQYYSNYNNISEAEALSGAAFLAIFMSFLVIGLIFGALVYVFVSICLMRIFRKAGVKPWIAWIPFYNNWKFLEIGGQPGFWAVLTIIPVVNIVSTIFLYIAMYHIGKKLGKESAFVVVGILLPYVWYPWLAFDKSTWNDAASTAPSLHQA